MPMSTSKKYIILPYDGNPERLLLENVEVKLTTQVKMDDIHKFVRYVHALEDLAFAIKGSEYDKYKKYFNKIENVKFSYAIPSQKD